MTIPLSNLKEKIKAKISSIESEDVLTKMMELGVMPGGSFVLENRAPFGGPIAILVNGTKIILRKNEAKSILIEI